MTFSLSPSAPVADSAVTDVTLSNFKAAVLEASQTALVLVVFWTPLNAACKQLVLSLEKLARATQGAVRLARADIDQNQAIAQQMGVQSAPSVFAFHQGRPIDAFAGVVPEAQIKSWIDQILQATGKGAEAGVGLDTAYKQAEDFLAVGDTPTARAIYADILTMEPENVTATLGLIRCCLAESDLAQAHALLDAAPAAVVKDKAYDALRATLELAEQAQQSQGQIEALEAARLKDPADPQTQFDLAVASYGLGRNEDAVDLLLDLVRRARTWNDDAARKQLVKLFDALGAMHPLTIDARKRLSSILFS